MEYIVAFDLGYKQRADNYEMNIGISRMVGAVLFTVPAIWGAFPVVLVQRRVVYMHAVIYQTGIYYAWAGTRSVTAPVITLT